MDIGSNFWLGNLNGSVTHRLFLIKALRRRDVPGCSEIYALFTKAAAAASDD